MPRDVARALRVDLKRPHTAHTTQLTQLASRSSTSSKQQSAQSKLESGKSGGGESICELMAKCLAPGPQTGKHHGVLQKVTFFEEKIVITPWPADETQVTTLDIARIGHAELDCRACSLKLRMVEGSQANWKGGKAQAGYVQIELEQPEFDTLRTLVWPLLLRSVFQRKAGAKFNDPPRGPSLVWSHA